LCLIVLEPAQHRIGELAVHLDMPFPAKGVGVAYLGRAGVTKQAAEDVREEARIRDKPEIGTGAVRILGSLTEDREGNKEPRLLTS